MKTQSSDSNPAYCPSCFRVVEDQRVFCFFCGQFIHAHVPTDSRLWDSRLSDLAILEPPPPEERPTIELPADLAMLEPPPPEEPPTIELPDDLLNPQKDPSSENTVRANDHSNPVYTTKDFDSRDKHTVDNPESSATTRFTEASANDPIVSEKNDIEQDEESPQDHQSTT